MATADSVTVLKHSLVSPPSSTAATEMSLSLTFLDMLWLHFSPIQRLVLYEVPQLSRSHFIEHVIPKLEHSLSLTLEQFLPLAGNLIVPPSNSNPSTPEIRYANGSSLALIIAECTTIDFNYLTANQARNSCDFYPLIPELKPSYQDDSGSIAKTSPVLALQVTLFPDCGMSIGISNHHTVGDAGTIFKFMKMWAALSSKILEDGIDRDEAAATLVSESLPFYDRSMIKDTKGLGSIFWDQWNALIKLQTESYTDATTTPMTKTDKVRKSFVISRNNIGKLKNLALQKRQELAHLSSFTVVCAYVWTCIVKCRGPSREHVDKEEVEYFCCLADCRGRMDPPLPSNYFGNCLTICINTEKNGKLIGEEGFPIAVELIGEGIHQRLKNNDALFDGAETWMTDFEGVNFERVVSVAGSPRYNYYNLDFGWGKPIKFEFISIETSGAISLNGCRDSDGDIEVGLSLPKPKLDAFTAIFNNGLNAL